MAIRMTESEVRALVKNGHVSTKEPLPAEKKKRKGKGKEEFQSYAERLYWETYVQPMLLIGEIKSYDLHRSFEVVPAVKWGNVNLRAKVYTPDFFLEMADGSIKVVELKGKVVRKLQRDYPLRRQLFILNYCIPNHWEFEEVSSEGLTKH